MVGIDDASMECGAKAWMRLWGVALARPGPPQSTLCSATCCPSSPTCSKPPNPHDDHHLLLPAPTTPAPRSSPPHAPQPQKRTETLQRRTRKDGKTMSLAATKRTNELEKDMNAWEENRLLTSGVARLREVGGGWWIAAGALRV